MREGHEGAEQSRIFGWMFLNFWWWVVGLQD